MFGGSPRSGFSPLKGMVPDEKGQISRASNYGSMNEEEEEIMRHKEEDSCDGLNNVYDINELVTFKVFGFYKGTVLESHALWKETIVMGLIYWSLFGVLFYFRWEHFSAFVGKESTIRAFIAMFSTLIGLLLCFYMSLNLGRWWQMRMAVQNIQEGSKKLMMMISQGVLHDYVLNETINRYARCSLFLMFAASQNEPGQDCPRVKAQKCGLLTVEESEKLQELNPHMTFVQAETLWVWLANMVTRLHDQGLTKGPPHYCALMAAVESGRSGVTDVQTYLETPIPLGYVHLLCLMVKFHNVILTFLMVLSCVALSGGEKGFQPVGVFRTSFRAFFMPFLYNAVLILNQEVTDPFGDDVNDFDWNGIDANLTMSGKSYSRAADIIPEFLATSTFKPLKTKSDPA